MYLNSGVAGKKTDIVLIDASSLSAVSLKDKKLVNLPEEAVKKYAGLEAGKAYEQGWDTIITVQSGGPGWLVIFKEPLSEAYAPVTKLKVTLVLLILITGGVAFLGAFALAQNLVKPVKVLMAGMETVSIGNLDYQIPEVSKDELGKVAVIFNNMTKKLKKLQEDLKRTERLSTIGQMSNILGHEIRNPLAAITNATYLINMELKKNPETNPKMFKRIEIIENEIKSTNKIINDMLDYSRSRPPVLSSQDLNALVRSLVEEAKRPENIKVDFEFGNIPNVNVDVEEMKQVIRNIVNNAVDSMVSNGGRLRLKTGRGSTAAMVKFEVMDTGSGIPKDILSKIFEPFFSTKSKGTGLGLAVVKRIVEERHNGIIRVTSEKDRGTTFTIELPVVNLSPGGTA